jgi:hypothetical protein
MAKMRSPNFPAIPLGQAIDLVGKIFREDRTNAIDKDVAAKHMGYTGLTGRTLKLLGALSQFGLVEKVAKGQIRVSKTAVSILHWSDEAEKREAIAKAGTAPVLFRRIRDSFEDPSDRTITSYLIKEGFTDTAIPAVLKSYKETNRFLADAGVSESYGLGAQEGADSFSDEDEDNEPMEEPRIEDFRLPTPPPIDAPLAVNFDMKSVSVSGRTISPAELRDFITTLTALADLLDTLHMRVKDVQPPQGEDG